MNATAQGQENPVAQWENIRDLAINVIGDQNRAQKFIDGMLTSTAIAEQECKEKGKEKGKENTTVPKYLYPTYDSQLSIEDNTLKICTLDGYAFIEYSGSDFVVRTLNKDNIHIIYCPLSLQSLGSNITEAWSSMVKELKHHAMLQNHNAMLHNMNLKEEKAVDNDTKCEEKGNLGNIKGREKAKAK